MVRCIRHVLSPLAVSLRRYSSILFFWCSSIWFDAGHVPDHSILPVLFCSYRAFPLSSCFALEGEFMVPFLLVFTVFRTAVNSDFVYSSTACFAMGLAVSFSCFCSASRVRLLLPIASRVPIFATLVSSATGQRRIVARPVSADSVVRETVSWFDVARVHDHKPLPVPVRRY